MSLFKKSKTIITHNGSFHPDDVFSVAVIDIYLTQRKQTYKIIRTRNPKLFKKANYLIDVGGTHNETENKFDHHQFGGSGQRKNGIPFASFGLVWKKFSISITQSERISQKIDKKLVQPIDAFDNGFGDLKSISNTNEILPYTIDHFIRSLNPNWLDGLSQDLTLKKFKRAVSYAKEILMAEINSAKAEIDSEEILDMLYEQTEDKRYLIIDKNYPWNFYLQKYPELLFVIEPAKEGPNFELEAVQTGKTLFERRKYLPNDWAGLRDQKLQEATGVKDAVFCHNGKFLAVAGSLEGAKSLVLKALEN